MPSATRAKTRKHNEYICAERVSLKTLRLNANWNMHFALCSSHEPWSQKCNIYLIENIANCNMFKCSTLGRLQTFKSRQSVFRVFRHENEQWGNGLLLRLAPSGGRPPSAGRWLMTIDGARPGGGPPGVIASVAALFPGVNNNTAASKLTIHFPGRFFVDINFSEPKLDHYQFSTSISFSRHKQTRSRHNPGQYSEIVRVHVCTRLFSSPNLKLTAHTSTIAMAPRSEIPATSGRGDGSETADGAASKSSEWTPTSRRSRAIHYLLIN